MGKNKLKHFEEMLSFPNVFQLDTRHKGKWKEVFQNDHAITLELACGKGEYTIGLAQLYPERNFIGVDIKGARIYTGAKMAIETGLENVRFLRTQIDHLPQYFETGEVEHIWITFPDPHLRESRTRHRLTSPWFLSIYKQVLAPGGIIHLKTDSDVLYKYTLEVIDDLGLKKAASTPDVYSEAHSAELDIQTYYERRHRSEGKTIKYVAFQLQP